MSGEKKYTWYKVAEGADEIAWQANGLCEIQVRGKTICLARPGGKLSACAHKCPHAGGRMADGYLDPAGNIVCPLHRYRFSMETGRNVSGEGYYLKTYKVEERSDGIYIGMEEGGFFGFLG